MRWRFSQSATDYDTPKHVRFDSAYGKGDNDMQVDAFWYEKNDDWSDWISVAEPSGVSAFYEGIAAGLSSECPEEPVHEDPRDTPLDALHPQLELIVPYVVEQQPPLHQPPILHQSPTVQQPQLHQG